MRELEVFRSVPNGVLSRFDYTYLHHGYLFHTPFASDSVVITNLVNPYNFAENSWSIRGNSQ